MNIFFIKTDKFLPYVDKSSITKDFSSQKRCIEYSLGRFLVKYCAKNFYDGFDTEIIIENKKPKFKNIPLCFSISHTKGIVAAAFDEFDIGFDIEIIKERNIENFARYLKKDFKNEIEFYRYWTCYEAQYKSKVQNLTSFKFENYMASVSSLSEINTRLRMYELVIPKNRTSPSELINLKLVNERSKNEIALEINEINTASFEFFPPPALKIE